MTDVIPLRFAFGTVKGYDREGVLTPWTTTFHGLYDRHAALKSHRKVLEKDVVRMRTLIDTIDKTIDHLKGTKKMNSSEELFAGFGVAGGRRGRAVYDPDVG